MKSPESMDERSRFSGHVRHYHRRKGKPKKSWDEWVDGKSAKTGTSKNWIKIAAVVVAIFTLGGIITGLIVELG